RAVTYLHHLQPEDTDLDDNDEGQAA
ncbi:hypothetical protein FHT77_006443, partial [Rhizobium sp. BK181]|nr:hypothetical protein [Rhizobium sp. BK181]MBB3320522.1 hypothetical protein [Rhizobium sp. BK181]